MNKKKKKGFPVLKVIGFVVFVGIVAAGITAYYAYRAVFAPNVSEVKTQHELFIPTGSDFEEVLQLLTLNEILKNPETFDWVAEKMQYPSQVKPGRYLLESGMHNRAIVQRLRLGEQEPVNLVINVMRTRDQLAGIVSAYLEADSAEIMFLLNDKAFLRQYGFTTENVLTLILPNTYQFYWSTSAKGFFERMDREHQRFWNEGRMEKANKLNLTPAEVSILASIVEEESKMINERPRIAGVYLNRIRRGWKLEADPTVKFAIGDFTIRRVLFRHLEYDSPYNTYRYAGIPPGPICIPSTNSIDAVLNAERHDFMFFSAKEDFSGYHNFARTLREHNANARKFHQELNRRNIYR